MGVQISTNVKAIFSDKRFKDILDKRLKERVERVSKEIADGATAEIQEVVNKAIARHPVVMSLEGGRGSLQAEFGLTNSMAQDAQSRLPKLFSKDVKVNIKRDSVQTRNKKVLQSFTVEGLLINIDTFNFAVSSEPFAYTSQGKASAKAGRGPYRIEWLKWLLAGSLDISDQIDDISDYGIANYGNFDTKRSRSGMAIMTRNKKLATRFPYLLPPIVVPRGGAKNFIEEVYKSKALRTKVSDVLRKHIKRRLRR